MDFKSIFILTLFFCVVSVLTLVAVAKIKKK